MHHYTASPAATQQTQLAKPLQLPASQIASAVLKSPSGTSGWLRFFCTGASHVDVWTSKGRGCWWLAENNQQSLL